MIIKNIFFRRARAIQEIKSHINLWTLNKNKIEASS